MRDGARRFPPLARAGAKLVVNAEDVIEELSTPMRAALVKAERPEAPATELAGLRSLGSLGKKNSTNYW